MLKQRLVTSLHPYLLPEHSMSPRVPCPRNISVLSRLLYPRSSDYRADLQLPDSAPGLTLIEGLVAIVVIAITVSAITPPIFVATATRIQTRRSEQAREIAQGEIDRVRNLMERGGATINEMPIATSTDAAVGGTLSSTNPRDVAVASSVLTSPILAIKDCGTSVKRYPDTSASPIALDRMIPVDVSGDCVPEYAMQVFRSPGYIAPGETAPFSFMMGVRVYSYFPGQVYPPLDAQPSSLAMTTGRRDSGGKQRPLAVLYSQISRNDSSRSLGLICRQNGGTNCQNNE